MPFYRLCRTQFILLCLLLLAQLHATGQDRSNRGKEFWLAYGFNYSFYHEPPINGQDLALYISTEQAATVTVSINNTGYSQVLNIPANTVDFSIIIPKSGVNDARVQNEGLFNRGIHIVSNVPVAAYAHQYAPLVSGATMLMPVETYGYSYYSVNYDQTRSNSSPADWYSWFFVIASEDNTRVLITPSDTTRGGWLPGQTYTVNLNKGELYNVFGKATFNGQAAFASKDMTGSKVVSIPGADGQCHPIGLFSGAGGIRLCPGDGGEYMGQQVFPAQAWGTRYLTYHMINNTATDVNAPFLNHYRVCVQDPSTVVKRNGVVLTGLIKNFFYEFSSTSGDYIESDKPVLVAQYTPNANQCVGNSQFSYGDPEMIYLSPIEQGQKRVLFYVSRKNAIDYVYTSVYLPTAATASLRVDGAALPAANIIPHPTLPAYSIALARFTGPGAQHEITCDSTFNAMVYGIGLFESYGYTTGTLLNNLNSYSRIQNTLNTSGQPDSFTCPKSPFRLYAKLAYPANSIHWKLSQVPGLSPNADSIISNPVPVGTELINNRLYYIYTLQQDFTLNTPGTYFIPLSYTATVIENCNQTENATVKLVVKPGPVSDFSFTAPACLKDSIRFTGAALSGGFTPASYLWRFDDNTTQTTAGAVKKFSAPGVQNVQYRIVAANGCVADTSKPVTVFDTPLAKFGMGNLACQGDSVRLTDSSTIGIGNITSWRWNFGDGSFINATNGNPVSHLYAGGGTFTITLVVQSGNGCVSDTARRIITINPKPLARFGTGGNICLGDSVRFIDSSSIVSGSIVNWSWNFGDGNSASFNNNTPFYHPYTNSGPYTVSLVTTSNPGCKSDTFRRNITVNNRPVVSFTAIGKPCLDSFFQFNSSIPFNTNAPASWYWNFGDGQAININSGSAASHAYTSLLSNITVKHVLSFGPGCVSDTARFVIPNINPNPIAAFSILPDTFCTNRPVQIVAPPGAGIAAWNWDFGNGTGSQTPPINRVYASAGNYLVSLKVLSQAGCGSALLSIPLTIGASPLISAGPDKFLSPGNAVMLEATLANASAFNLFWTPAQYLSSSAVLNPLASPPAPQLYTITAVDRINLCRASDQVLVTPISKLLVPNAFTPDGNGKNDLWRIPALALYPDAVVTVYNRWGEKIYQSADYANHPWDGRFKGVLQPTDVYVYFISLPTGPEKSLKGTVMIIRD